MKQVALFFLTKATEEFIEVHPRGEHEVLRMMYGFRDGVLVCL